jgi:hypothetical protein
MLVIPKRKILLRALHGEGIYFTDIAWGEEY